MVLYLHVKLYRKVVITGGTHGNERIGVLLAQQWQTKPEAVTRSTFQTQARQPTLGRACCVRRGTDAHTRRHCLILSAPNPLLRLCLPIPTPSKRMCASLGRT